MEREDAREVLKWMLGKVKRAEIHKRELTERLERINEDRLNPIKAVNYDLMPRSSGTGDGALGFLLKLEDIEERIYEQRSEIENSIVQVMDIIDFIPQHETARRIFELRHLDCLNFQEVADAIPMSKSRTYEIYNETIDRLLGFERITQMCKESEAEYLEWFMDMEDRKQRARSKKQSGGIRPQNKSRKKKRKK